MNDRLETGYTPSPLLSSHTSFHRYSSWISRRRWSRSGTTATSYTAAATIGPTLSATAASRTVTVIVIKSLSRYYRSPVQYRFSGWNSKNGLNSIPYQWIQVMSVSEWVNTIIQECRNSSALSSVLPRKLTHRNNLKHGKEQLSNKYLKLIEKLNKMRGIFWPTYLLSNSLIYSSIGTRQKHYQKLGIILN